MKVMINLQDAETMLKKRGLEPNGRVQRLFTQSCAREMDPYTPMSAGSGAHMKNIKNIQPDAVIYPGPYSRFLYYGKVMIGILTGSAWAKRGEKKIVTEEDLTYHGAPLRGKKWDARMWKDKKEKIVSEVARAAGGKPG